MGNQKKGNMQFRTLAEIQKVVQEWATSHWEFPEYPSRQVFPDGRVLYSDGYSYSDGYGVKGVYGTPKPVEWAKRNYRFTSQQIHYISQPLGWIDIQLLNPMKEWEFPQYEWRGVSNGKIWYLSEQPIWTHPGWKAAKGSFMKKGNNTYPELMDKMYKDDVQSIILYNKLLSEEKD